MTDDIARRILLLEDQGIVRAGIRELIKLEEPRAHIEEASTYEQAIGLITKHDFDIAFLDYDLRSEKTGFELLEYLKQNDSRTLVVMVSATDDKSTVLKCLDAGASGYIPKDLDEDGIFKRALETVFHGGVFLPGSVLGKGGHSPLRSIPATIQTLESLALPPRQLEAVKYLLQGLPNKTIADRMGIAEGTVRKDYVSPLLARFGVRNRTELVVEIARRGIRIA